jgi:hypothetical protein
MLLMVYLFATGSSDSRLDVVDTAQVQGVPSAIAIRRTCGILSHSPLWRIIN